jgi:uncharacterized protein YndB with AHSA1/START domain
MGAKNKSNELRITRIYEHPLRMVWDAWTDPNQVAKWWGPRGFTLTTHSKDLRSGGNWVYTMHGPDGIDYPNKTYYHEVEQYTRLVYDHGGNDDRPPLFKVIVDFSDLGNHRTKMDMRMVLPTPEAAEETRKFVKKARGDSTWDRLAEYLSEQSSGKDIFQINRSFDAPRDVVFEMWTNPKHVAQWMAPKGFSMEYLRADLRAGGETFYSMTNGADVTMYGKANYIEVDAPHRLVYTQVFCDPKGEKITRHPHAPTWPAVMLTTVTFAEESPDRTRVTVNWEVHGEATKEERDTFHAAKAGMSEGWTGSFDKFEDYLAKRASM